MVDIDLTTLSGYDNLAAGTHNIAVKAKAANYQDSDLSATVSFTKLAAPTITASDTTVTWDAITNAESYDVYVDGELYENTTGGVTLISFTIDGTTYQAEEGMTWGQWVASSYNTDEYIVLSLGGVGPSTGTYAGYNVCYRATWGSSVGESIVIEEGHEYYLISNN